MRRSRGRAGAAEAAGLRVLIAGAARRRTMPGVVAAVTGRCP
jgi:phosphoribosylcarboxyaminoimidazole (NCAIR) mutase